MEIDNRVEPLVREALAAIVGKDPDRLERAVTAFPDDDAMTKGVQLACSLILYTLQDLYEGRRPTADEIRELANDTLQGEDWTDVSAQEVVDFVTAVFDRRRIDSALPLDRAALLAYVIAANLVSSYHEDNEEWWDYLDRAEAAIEATPTS